MNTSVGGDPVRARSVLRRSLWVFVPLMAVGVGAVGFHDAYCHYVDLDRGSLCRRADGSLWRDASMGCGGHEDPRCRYEACADSEFLSEGWRHSCSWVVLRTEVPPSGPAPYYDGDSPGRGVPGRIG